MTQANESEGGCTDHEFALEDLSSTGRHQQPDATFAPGVGGGITTDRSRQTTQSKTTVDQQQRDLLLLRCRDAIEELHHEIEDERNAKTQVQREVQEAHAVINELRIREKELVLEIEQLHEKNSTLCQDLQEQSELKDAKSKLQLELQQSVREKAALQEQVSRANEALMKADTVSEVAKTKESQLHKDLDQYEKQMEQ